VNLADLPPMTRGLPMFDDPRSPLAGERRHDMPRPAAVPMPQPVGAGGPATLLSTIDRHLALARRTGQHLALLAVAMQPPQGADGAPAGLAAALADALAVEFGHRLRARVRATDVVLWQGGCEHVVLLQPCRQVGGMAARQRLLQALGGTYRLGAERLTVTALIGCASYPAAGDTSAQLLAAALAARGDAGLHGQHGAQ
jgi:predicted signal transduction protein with EAL and GGDEF domain